MPWGKPNPQKAVVRLLCSLFSDTADLRGFFEEEHSDEEFVDALPEDEAGKRAVARAAYKELHARGELTVEFFDILRCTRPRRTKDIKKACAVVLGQPEDEALGLSVSDDGAGGEQEPLGEWQLLLDRTSQWKRLRDCCATAKKPFGFLVHGANYQNLELFVERSVRYFNLPDPVSKSAPPYHAVYQVRYRDGEFKAMTREEWATHTCRAMGHAGHGLERALEVVASRDRVLLVIGDGHLESLPKAHMREMNAFLERDLLPAAARVSSGDNKVHVLVPVIIPPRTLGIDFSATPRKRLAALFERAAKGGAIGFERMDPLDFPPPSEVVDEVRRRYPELSARDLEQCRDCYENFRTVGEITFRQLADGLLKKIRKLRAPAR